ncbi:Transposon Ty3-G Gag-Pol polyprotein,Transposon Ty3-I Gag-Pol polyprotein [Mytilus edulis]|uniref:Transposon Ty3-G Gag-Pol polyprotein,Transposon Ty3-I Gag-Pol polyprotein n=1 Tax=Mytilus edulis TaxID=6550 RepID=A0A8S3UCW1_MYTED|nr:Transposon Ty3-G Gag-Pol polyprotein,Transposon Ty3-I Gag-Pol polyprotein [Mytilus edulis]
MTKIPKICRLHDPVKTHDISENVFTSSRENKVDEFCSEVPEYLKELFQNSCKNIKSNTAKKTLADVLVKHKDAFAKSKTELGSCSVLKHRIDTAHAAPVRQPLRRTPQAFEKEEEKYLRDQIETGVVRPSSSAWSSPVVFVRKKDGSVRWCVDYRKVNDLTIKDAYPLPRIDMCLDCLSSAKIFSCFDLQSGYWQIELNEKDREKTAFTTKYGLFEYTKMPFGLCNARVLFKDAWN